MSALETLLPDISPELLGWVSTVSILTFLASLVLVPVIAVRIPTHYFDETRRGKARLRRTHPAVYLVVRIMKNLLAVILVVGGIMMLVLPGQGLLTILIGVGVSDFPGKYRLERRLIAVPGILTAINWIRDKAGVEPLTPPQSAAD